MPKTSGFRTIICIDVENFSSTRRNHSDHLSIRESLDRVAKEALRELNEPLDDFHIEDRGDGMLIIAPAGINNDLLAKMFLRVLDQRVRRHNESTSRPECGFRLRAAIDVGDVEFDKNGVAGKAIITACRMLDSHRLKTELAKSNNVALAACISRSFYEHMIGGMSIDAEFRKRPFRGKNATGSMWVWTGNGCGVPRLARLGIGAVVLTLAAAGIWLIPGSIPATQSLLGLDPRMADPCALAAPDALSRFGRVEFDSEYQEFSRCDVIVRSDESKVHVTVQFQNLRRKYARYAATVGRIGLFTFKDTCKRIIFLPGGYSVEIDATQESTVTDPCVMSDVATEHAINVLNKGPVPQRADRMITNSLFHAKACDGLDNWQLSQFPGIDADEPDAGFGHWSCSWKSTTYRMSLKVVFGRSPEPDVSNKRPVEINWRSSFMKPEMYGRACVVQTPSPLFQNEASPAKAEVLLIVVEGETLVEVLCEYAARVAN